MELGDVLLNLHVWVGLLATTRIVRIWEQSDSLWIAAGWVVVCAVTVFWRPGIWLLAAATFAVQFALGGNEGTVIIGWVALAVGLFHGRDLLTALRVLTVSVYAFAAINKMFPRFLTGFLLEAYGVPYASLVAPATVWAEAAVAVLVWRRARLALPAAVVMHTGIVFVIPWHWVMLVGLAGFNVVMVFLVWLTTRYDKSESYTRKYSKVDVPTSGSP